MSTNKSDVKAVCADADSNKPVTPGQDNSFDRALERAVELMREGGVGGRVSCSNALVEVCYTLFRIRVASVCRDQAGFSQALMDEVVQECVVNFWQSLEKGGAMAKRLAALEGKDLRAYLAGVVRASSQQRLWQVLRREIRQRGYLHATADLARREDGGPDSRTWWETMLEAAQSDKYRPEGQDISPLDLEAALRGKALGTGFEGGLIEAAAEFFGSSGHEKLASFLLEAAKAAAEPPAKSKRTVQRRRMECKQQLGRDLEM